MSAKLKVCTCCTLILPTGEFYRCARSRDGLRSWCRTCFMAANSAYRARPEIAERRRARERQKARDRDPRPRTDRDGCKGEGQGMTAAAEKMCRRCKFSLPRDRFGRHSGSRDGLHNYCRECSREVNRIYRRSATGMRWLREGPRLSPDVRAERKRRVLETMEQLRNQELAVSDIAIIRLAGPGCRDFRLVRSLRAELIAEGNWVPDPVVPSLRSRVRTACYGLLDAGTYPDRGRLEPLFPGKSWASVASARRDVLRSYPGPIPARGERAVAEVEAAIAAIRRARAKQDGARPRAS